MPRMFSKTLIGLAIGATAALGTWQHFTGGSAAAQSPGSVGADPAILATYQWRNIGPDRGGRSLTVAGALQRPI